MTPENTQKLYLGFPRLYRGKDKSHQESMMHFGFDCDDAWFDLIWNLSHDIENQARKEGVDLESDEWPEATQVKEKFGTLRFYIKHASDEIRSLIDKAEQESGRIGVETGNPYPKASEI